MGTPYTIAFRVKGEGGIKHPLKFNIQGHKGKEGYQLKKGYARLGGILVETMRFDRRVVGSNPTLAAM